MATIVQERSTAPARPVLHVEPQPEPWYERALDFVLGLVLSVIGAIVHAVPIGNLLARHSLCRPMVGIRFAARMITSVAEEDVRWPPSFKNVRPRRPVQSYTSSRSRNRGTNGRSILCSAWC